MVESRCARRLLAGIVTLALAALMSACATPPAESQPTLVVFVCEHGNVKSLMAASYFNEISREQRLPFRAVSRGVAPDSDRAPEPIARKLAAEGFDVSGFRPKAVSMVEIKEAGRVVTIGAELPTGSVAANSKIERWNDIPAASVDYASSRDALKKRISELLERLVQSEQP